MSATAHSVRASPVAQAGEARPWLERWWPLALVTLLAAALRLSTLNLQSFWYDEAFTPVHVLHPSLWATLRAVVHSENTPPLWYAIAWAFSRVLGTGEIALRLPSALAGIATVPVAWGIGRELAGRRAALACALLVAVSPLMVWYSQEARAYGLFVLTGALALLCCLRAERQPTPARMAAFALCGALALLSHYFAVFMLIPMVLWLLWRRRARRATLPAAGALVVVGLALVPLISAQGGHGTQWIGRWPLLERLEAIPQYFLTGYTGAALGHGVELLVALPILAGLGLGLWRLSEPRATATRTGAPSRDGSGVGATARAREGTAVASAAPPGDGSGVGATARAREGTRVASTAPHPDRSGAGVTAQPGAWEPGEGSPESLRRLCLALAVAACGVLIPLALVAFGADYLAPRNLVAAMVPVSAVIAVVALWPARPGHGSFLPGVVVVATIAIALLAITIDVDLSPRLQRGNWRDLAHEIAHPGGAGALGGGGRRGAAPGAPGAGGALTAGAAPYRVITTVELGSTPLEYYLPGLHGLREGTRVLAREIVETGYAPLRAGAALAPAPGFRLRARLDVDGLIAYRFLSTAPRLVSEATLRRHVITPEATPDVLVAPDAHVVGR